MKRNNVMLFLGLIGFGIAAFAAYEMRRADESVSRHADGTSLFGELGELATGPLEVFEFAPERVPMPDIELIGPDGPVTFSDFKGQVLLVNLWAEWCAPCIKELPTLNALEAALGSEDFRVLPISLDRGTREQAQAVMNKYGAAGLITLADPTMALMAEAGVMGLPTTFLVDREGREIGRLVGPAEWDAPEIEAFLKAAIGSRD